MTTKYVYLGRFSPFHLGHQELLAKMINKFGVENCLVIVGSSSSRNERTPYDFDTRKKMIGIVEPRVEVLPLPDVNPSLNIFDGSTNEAWLDSLNKLAQKREEKFVFCGGSEVDLLILGQRFKTVVLNNRHESPTCISATAIREALRSVDKRLWRLMIDNYSEK